MAKDRSSKRNAPDKPRKKGFFASFFEPADGSEGMEYDPEFDGEELLPDDGDEDIDDDAPLFPLFGKKGDQDGKKERKQDKRARKQAHGKKRLETIQLFDDADEPSAPDASEDTEALSAAEVAAYSERDDLNSVDRLTWDDGEPVVDDPYALAEQAGDPLSEENAPELPEEIRLFDDAEQHVSTGNRRSGRTRIFKTGSGTAARVHINDTEPSLMREAAAKKQREKEAAKKHAEYVEKQKRKRKRRKMLRQMFGNIAFVLVLVVAVFVALYYSFLLSDIVITGNETYSTEYIIGLSGLKLGRHMLFNDLEAAQTGISEDPYLQVDSITYIFPSRIRIAVTERKEVAGIIGLDYNVIIDHNGYVLSMGGGTDLTNLVQVSGVGMTGFQLGQRLGESDDFGTATLVSIIGKLEEYELLDDITAIDLTTPLAITMISRSGLRIHVGQPTELDEKMVSLHKLLPQFAAISYGTLYLSAKGGTVYSQVDVDALLVTGTTAAAGTGTVPDATSGVDNDGDGLDDNTGEPIASFDPNVTPDPGAASTPAVTPGSADPFQG